MGILVVVVVVVADSSSLPSSSLSSSASSSMILRKGVKLPLFPLIVNLEAKSFKTVLGAG